MITVLASIRIAEGRRGDFLEIFSALVPKVRLEDGCIEYFPAVDLDAALSAQHLDENAVTVIEKWRSLEALRAHFAAPHMLEYKEAVKDLVEDLSVKILQQA